MTHDSDFDSAMMRRAIELAYQGRGLVEPNPMVGCVVARDKQLIAEGFHQRFGESHAEVNALRKLNELQREGSTIYVTLEPCTHIGKTPPCVDLVIASKPKRVVIGVTDPFPEVSGRGIAKLRAKGIQVDVGIEEGLCRRLIAPFAKRQTIGLPWIIGKWAMTFDGRMATSSGDSKWITGDKARAHAHDVRGRMDAIVVGIGTALADDPLLNARPAGSRIAKRVVVDSLARLPLKSRLVSTSREIETIVACGPEASPLSIEAISRAGCLVHQFDSADRNTRLRNLMTWLGEIGCTNVLVDGGPNLLGSLFDQRLLDEVHVYLGSKLLGGPPRLVPNQGLGVERIDEAISMNEIQVEQLGNDVLIQGFSRVK
jgi:diaminohydroxyphosphoribosylaminopyrimidine deaminase/5-amino-6-(5-phosphoribosylamino)uracil reductase